jgi:hypothetical protein
MLAWTLLGAVAPARAADPSPCAMLYPSDARIDWECRRVAKGESLESLFGDAWVEVARFNRIDRRHVRVGSALRVPKKIADVSSFTPLAQRYEPGAAEIKLVLVDLSEQFLGAYEYGNLVFSAPIASGRSGNPTPAGSFRITAANRTHESSLYTIEGTATPYPMHFGLMFHVTSRGVRYWIHGRDMPGYPASHGCVGMSDEAMQAQHYGVPRDPQLADARMLYEWVLGDMPDPGGEFAIEGPRVEIIGRAPR